MSGRKLCQALIHAVQLFCCWLAFYPAAHRYVVGAAADAVGGGGGGRKGGGGDMTSYILGGDQALPKQYPFYVQVFQGPLAVCGGSLVAPDVVLSAAHCFVDSGVQGAIDDGTLSPSDLYVLVGAATRDDPSVGDAEYRRVIEFQVHPKYQEGILGGYDALLIKIERVTKPHLQPIALNFKPNVPQDYQRLRVVGLGLTESSDLSLVLRFTDMNVESLICYFSFKMDPDIVLCAVDYEGFDSSICNGDSGGPLFDNSVPSSPVQVGLVSFGHINCQTDYVQGFTRISGLQNWLRRTICALTNVPGLVSICNPAPLLTEPTCARKGSKCALKSSNCCPPLKCRKAKKKSPPRCGLCSKKKKACGNGLHPCCPPLKCITTQSRQGLTVKKCL